MTPKSRFILNSLCIGMVLFLGLDRVDGHQKEEMATGYRLSVTWSLQGSDTLSQSKELRSWTLGDLESLKKTGSREKDPHSGKMVKWEGVLLSHLIEKTLAHLPNEERAQVDLVVLKSKSNKKALIPRALVNKYPILLAFRSSSEAGRDSFEGRGPVFSVVPWSSKPKILQEDLPLENFFLPQITQIELTNYRNQYSPLFLKRRTDPSAMRGEKLFVQNCVTCHADGAAKPMSVMVTAMMDANLNSSAKQNRFNFINLDHPNTGVTLKLTDRDRKSIIRYLDAHHSEQSSISSPAHPGNSAEPKGSNGSMRGTLSDIFKKLRSVSPS